MYRDKVRKIHGDHLPVEVSPEPFVHSPLDLTRREIRLVRLQPRPSHDISVQLELRHFDVEDAALPHYHALSYMWGPASPSYVVQINGRTIKIRENLFSFLEEALRRQFGHWIWIDQLSIAQENTPERNHQVSLMAQIYGMAETVISWLGHHGHGTLEYPTDMSRLDSIPDIVTSKKRNALFRRANSLLCINPYWRRLWIVQEVKLARNLSIWAGRLAIDASFFHNSLNLFKDSDTLGVMWLLNKFDGLPKKRTFYTMYEIIQVVSTCKCEDARDVVFGIQALLRDDERVAVDYSKTVKEVFHDTVMIMFWESENNWGQDSSLTTFIEVIQSLRRAMLPSVHVKKHKLMRDILAQFLWSVLRAKGFPAAPRPLEDIRSVYVKQMTAFRQDNCDDERVQDVLDALGLQNTGWN